MSVSAIIAALPREIAPLVRGLAADRELLAQGIHLYKLRKAVVVTAGMGAARAALAVEAALRNAEVHELISVGLAGACSADLCPGEAVSITTVVDAQTGERFATSDHEGHLLVSSTGIASVHEKARLRATYGAAVVDMEAATVGRFAAAKGLGFRAIKAISDAHDFELASLSRFATARGQFRTGSFALHTALRPHRWRPTMRLGRTSASAIAALHQLLSETVRG